MHYSCHRPHIAAGDQPPASQLPTGVTERHELTQLDAYRSFADTYLTSAGLVIRTMPLGGRGLAVIELSAEEEDLFRSSGPQADTEDRSNVIEGQFVSGDASSDTTDSVVIDRDVRSTSSAGDGASLSSVINGIIRDAAEQVPQGLMPAAPAPTNDPLLASIQNDAYTKLVTVLAGPGGALHPDGIKALAQVANENALNLGTREQAIRALIAVHLLEGATSNAKQAQLGRQGEIEVRKHSETLAVVDAEHAMNNLKRELAKLEIQVDVRRGQIAHETGIQRLEDDRAVQSIVREGTHKANLVTADTTAYVVGTDAAATANVVKARANYNARRANRVAWRTNHKEWLVGGGVMALIIIALILLLVLR